MGLAVLLAGVCVLGGLAPFPELAEGGVLRPGIAHGFDVSRNGALGAAAVGERCPELVEGPAEPGLGCGP